MGSVAGCAINWSSPEQNGRYFADDIFQMNKFYFD